MGRVGGGGLVSRRHPCHSLRLHRALRHALPRYTARLSPPYSKLFAVGWGLLW